MRRAIRHPQPHAAFNRRVFTRLGEGNAVFVLGGEYSAATG